MWKQITHYGSWSTLLLSLLICAACGRVDPTNPYDPDTPPEQQHRAALIGQVTVQDGPLDEILRATRIFLEGASNDQRYQVAVRQDGRFRFDEVLSGHYILSAEAPLGTESYQLLNPLEVVLEPQSVRSLTQPLILTSSTED